jgi:Cu/Ag efflux pump CusA
LLTTATTIGGLIPLWLGGGTMFEPMAIAIIFGLLFSTVLTLGVVPTLYAVLFAVKQPVRGTQRRLPTGAIEIPDIPDLPFD